MIHHIRSIDKEMYIFQATDNVLLIPEHLDNFLSGLEAKYTDLVVYDIKPLQDGRMFLLWAPVEKKTRESIFKELPDPSQISEQTKKEVLEAAMVEAGKILMATFQVLGLKTHMECTLEDDTSSDRFSMTFRKIAGEPQTLHNATPESLD